VSIDSSGTWWRGTEPRDIEAFLKAYTASKQPIREFRPCICPCGGKVFLLEGDPREGGARRTCFQCRTGFFIADSEENWDDFKPVACRCVECHTEPHQAGVGFALDEHGEVLRIFVGVRCVNCGVLGCFAHWKIGYAPSRHLLDLV